MKRTPISQAARCASIVALFVVSISASAQTPAPSLKTIFEAAWARAPQHLAGPEREAVLAARQRAARALSPEPAALELTEKTDRFERNEGAREREVGIVAPLWLPNERTRAMALADAEVAGFAAQQDASRLRVALVAREVFWAAQRARIEQELAENQLAYAAKLAEDVARRVKAGDLARVDQHQAEAARERAKASLAKASAAYRLALSNLQALAGRALDPDQPLAAPEPERDGPPELANPALEALAARARAARHSAELAATRTRAHPALRVARNLDRGAGEDATRGRLVIGLSLPFGGAGGDEMRAQARADALEAEAELTIERERIRADLDAARARVDALQVGLRAAERRAELARESRRLFEKSFALGQTDLPTRLRIGAEALEAEREAALFRIDHYAAISALRQAEGLLPQ